MPTLPAAPAFPSSRALGLAAGLALVLLASGCAKQKSDPNYYEPPPGSSASDANRQARNVYNRSVVSAPSQIQVDLKPSEPGVADASGAETAPSGHASVIPQPQTYLGTLPCFHQNLKCTAQRITLTLAPNGRWRARAGYLQASGQSGSDQTDQGCWRAIPERQPRIMLMERNGNVRAELVMTQGNVLRLRTLNGEAPTLAYHLTRQPDLDPIDELSGQPAPACE